MSSQIVAKKTFYSGQLVLVVHLLEGHHVEPQKRRAQVKGCDHNVVYRVTIKPHTKSSRGERSVVVMWVCPPAHLEHGVDSLTEMRSAAHAALSFAADEGHPIEEYAAFTDSGWHVGATKLHAWPREPKPRRDPMRILPAPKRHPMSVSAREKRREKIDPFKESVVSANPPLYTPGDRVVTRWGLEGTVIRIQHEFWEYGGRAFYLVEDARGVKHSFPEESIAKKARRRR